MGIDIINWFSLWETVRSAGVIAFILLSLSVIGGLATSFMKNGKTKMYFQMIHQISGWFGFWFAFMHTFLLLFDHYTEYRFVDLILPFVSEHERLWTGLGVLSLWGMFFVLLSSDGMKKLGKTVWKKVHYFSIPVYLFSLIHGVFLGTDSTNPLIAGMYVVSGILFVAGISIRISWVLWQKRFQTKSIK